MKHPPCITLLFALLALSACTPSLAGQIDRSEARWQAAGISSYKIEVLQVSSIWHAQSYAITVENGKVTDSSSTCIPAPMESGQCTPAPFEPADFTVPGLFELARSKSRGPGAEFLTIRFNQQYGYPEQIAFDNPQAVDDDSSWSVKSLQVIP